MCESQSGHPPPNLLQGYEDIVTGGAYRIVTMAEDEARHRRAMERERLNIDSKLELRGQFFGYCIAAGSIVVSFLAIAAFLTASR